MECDCANDGAGALRLLRAAAAAGRPYALALIDRNMDGHARARARACDAGSPELPCVPILILSSAAAGRDALRRAGVHGVLTKPDRASRLRDEIKRILGAAGRRRRARGRRAPRPPAVAGRCRGPWASAHERARLPPPSRRRHGYAADSDVRCGAPRVLLAEDNEINQMVAVNVLEKCGYRVDLAQTGREAVEMSRRGRYEAIFMDCRLPELDGYSAASEIRRLEASRPAHADHRDHRPHDARRPRECLAAGMDEYIAKPLRRETLVTCCAAPVVTGPAPRPETPAAGPARRTPRSSTLAARTRSTATAPRASSSCSVRLARPAGRDAPPRSARGAAVAGCPRPQGRRRERRRRGRLPGVRPLRRGRRARDPGRRCALVAELEHALESDGLSPCHAHTPGRPAMSLPSRRARAREEPAADRRRRAARSLDAHGAAVRRLRGRRRPRPTPTRRSRWPASTGRHAAIVDVEMPSGGGLRATREIAACSPGTAVLVLSSDESDAGVVAMLQAGAVSYFRKGLTAASCRSAVEESIDAHGRCHAGARPAHLSALKPPSAGPMTGGADELRGRPQPHQPAGGASWRRSTAPRPAQRGHGRAEHEPLDGVDRASPPSSRRTGGDAGRGGLAGRRGHDSGPPARCGAAGTGDRGAGRLPRPRPRGRAGCSPAPSSSSPPGWR